MKRFAIVLALIFGNIIAKAQFLDEISVKLHDPSDLKKDVWLAQTILEKENPNLYLYISKKQLNKKFDSLRNTIREPITSIGLYVKLLSVISYIGDGHLTINLDFTKLSLDDVAVLKKPSLQHPIYQFDYHVIANRLYVIKNATADSSIKVGTEILAINKVPAAKLIDSLSQYITSDGFNTTYKKFLMNKGYFAERYRFLYPKKEPLTFDLRSEQGIKELTLNSFQKVSYSLSVSPLPTVEYKLLSPDSNIAYVKIRTFYNDDKFVGYDSIFSDIKKRNLETLIIDLRDNIGGATHWSSSVYSYLIDTPTYFYRLPSEIIKQKILFDNPQIRNWAKRASTYKFPTVKPKASGFRGKIYVLINGGSFSATSLLAANLQNLKNVTFVGEETGGSKNIWTAGVMKNVTLPATKLLLTYGNIPAYFGNINEIDGKGVMPDIPISYDIEQYLAKKDLEVEWVIKDIAKEAQRK